MRFVSLSELGIYAIANKLVSMLTLLVEPFKAAWNPLALSIQQQKEAPRTYAKILTYFSAGGLGIGLALVSLLMRFCCFSPQKNMLKPQIMFGF